MKTLEALKKLSKKICSSASDTDLNNFKTVDKVIDYIAMKYDSEAGGGGGGDSGNLLTAPVSFNSASMTDPTIPIINYSLGLKIDNTYTLDITIDGENHVVDDLPAIPSGYPNSADYYGGVTLGTMGSEAIMVTLANGKTYMVQVIDKAEYSMTSGAIYDPNKASFLCMEFSETGNMAAVPVTINSIVLKSSVPEERLSAPITIPAQSASNITGLTVQGELNLGSEATTDAPKPCVLYKLEGMCDGQTFTLFLAGGYAHSQYYQFGIYGTYGGGATACDRGEASWGGSDLQTPIYGITGIAMNAAWNGTDFVAAEGSWAIRVERFTGYYTNGTGTPEIIVNSIKRINLPNLLTADISMSNHVVAENNSTQYYAVATKPTGVSLEAGARYLIGINAGNSESLYATGIAYAEPTLNNCVIVEGYSGYGANATNKPNGAIYITDGALYKSPTDDTQQYDPTKWTFGASVDSSVTAFYLAKIS